MSWNFRLTTLLPKKTEVLFKKIHLYFIFRSYRLIKPFFMNAICLAAAHTTPYLPELVEELRSIEDSLDSLRKRGIWAVHSNRAANLDDVFKAFSENAAEIKVFHYCGHANQSELSLEGGGHIRGIAGLFGLSEPEENGVNPLYFVFLNGCATEEQVNSLHAAGVAAVIATSRPIGDTAARIFAEAFYKYWSVEGKTMQQAYDLAKAFLHSRPAEQHRDLEVREAGHRSKISKNEPFAWGLYPHPVHGQVALGWQLNPTVQLPPQILADVRPQASESLLELVFKFEENDADARAEIQSGKDPLLVLITRLPWTIGTHLRRLFAMDDTKSMATPGLERLRELVSGYNELTRFISYISLSALWDERQRARVDPQRLGQLPLLPDVGNINTTDYIWLLRQYFALQKEIPDDPFGAEPHLEKFLQTVDTSLADAYLFMEELKIALSPSSEPGRIEDLVQSRTGKSDGLADLCLQAEVVFNRFLEASLWLTKYRLYTVRSILVDKIRYLELKEPYIHKTMALHGAFSDIELLPTKREIPSDNSCILLAPSHPSGTDPLAGALNLSPFYIDKSSYLEEKAAHYPALYVLKYERAPGEFVFEYIDGDVNHEYRFAEDHQLVVKNYGAVFPAALKIDLRDSQKFQVVHQQLIKLKSDFHQA